MKSAVHRHLDAEKNFEELYNENFARVNRYLRYRVINTWDADDLTALVFMKALEKFHTYRGESSFSAWILRIAHNVYVDYVRKDREVATPEEKLHRQVVEGAPEEEMLLNEEVDELRSFMNELPPDYRDVIALRYAGELRFKQIGEVLGKSEVAVRMMHHRAIKMLRGRMNKTG
ncbi:RNA polymerase sigma-70 factor (ECF subfamily) [Desulfohalotomaculum tongense]|uniref:RNA polymerase sigma factor n=1 Tax=Desulforadius tongensis TaxID=1216062 RepID=UPI0019561290|nr:sigma-70 family RNA polymerase sigma factor [Desulforadius tongensis]MBM7856015.1 RNA polymerase sigma-70 factor (ECF subfamily) [Desulforadius tongensis]